MSRNRVNQTDGSLTQIAGRGKAEYGASTIRTGTIEIPKYEDGDNIGKELTVTFDTPMPDSDYLLDINSFSNYNIYTLAVRNKTANGFTLLVRLSFAQSTTITGTANPRNLYYTAFKLYTDTEYNELLDVQDITLTYPSGVTGRKLTCFKVGHVVYLQGSWSGSITGTTDTIVTIPAEFRPSKSFYLGGTGRTETTSFRLGYTIGSNGNVTQTATTGTVTDGDICGSWYI